MLYFIISPKSDNFLLLHTTWSFILLSNIYKFYCQLSVLLLHMLDKIARFIFLFPVDLPALKEVIPKQCEIWSRAWQPSSLEMKCQVSRQCRLQEQSRFSQGKDCLQSSGSTLGLTGRKQSQLSFCKWLHKKHSPFHHHPQRGLELQGSGRYGEGLRSYSKWDAFACSVLSRWQYISDNVWLGSPPHSFWISHARDPEMKVGWVHSIPKGMLVWVCLCLPVGKVGQKPSNWYIHSSFKPSQGEGSGPTWGSSDAKM